MSRIATKARRGVVLVFVLWVLMVLTALCLGLNGWVRSQAWRTGRCADDERGAQALRSALAAASALLAADGEEVDWLGDGWAGADSADFSGRVNGATVALFTPSPSGPAAAMADEAARLNANTADVEMLAALDGMDRTAATAFVAARDELQTRISVLAGEPSGPDAGLTGPIRSPEQLAAMLCETLGLACVDAAAPAGRPWENPRQWPAPVAMLMDRLTVFSRTLNRSADGAARVNLNTAAEAALNTRLGDALSPAQIDGIVKARDQQSFSSIGELLMLELTIPDGDGGSVDISVRRGQFRQIVDRLTTTDRPILLGRINVNTASREVLACLPGLTELAIDAMLTHRGQADAAGLTDLGWLLDVLTDKQLTDIAPFVTTRSRQFRFQIACQDLDGAAATYAEAVIERGAGGNGVLYLESHRGIWDDPRGGNIPLATGGIGW